MARIISASRRTDIPAFYAKWFMNRIRAGFCHWINPFGGQVYRVSLRPEDCLGIVFWTRNPRPMLDSLDLLARQGYRFYFHFTINGYPEFMESHNPPMEDAIAAFRQLSAAISPEQVLWRYDPILLSDRTPRAYHLQRFDYLSKQLAGHTHRCYFSFADFYGKTERNLRRVEREHNVSFRRPTIEEQRQLADQMRDIAAARGITLYTCCGDHLTSNGIEKAHCISLELLLQGLDGSSRLKAAPTRQECGCVEATDIGTYDSCAFGCAYCYATNSREAALARLRAHDPEDTVLWRPATMVGVDLATLERKTRASDLAAEESPGSRVPKVTPLLPNGNT